MLFSGVGWKARRVSKMPQNCPGSWSQQFDLRRRKDGRDKREHVETP
jgi:hypothetical protein